MPPPKKTAEEFFADLCKSEELRTNLYKLLKEDKDVKPFIEKEGYGEFSHDELQRVAEAASSGSGFKLSSVGGFYKFTGPADLVQQRKWLLVDPSHESLYVGTGNVDLGRTKKDYQVWEAGEILWKEGDTTYEIKFFISSTDDAKKHVTFTGTRTGSQDAVGGEESTSWVDDDAAKQTLAVMSIIGFFLGIGGTYLLQKIFKCVRKKLGYDEENDAERERRELLEGMNKRLTDMSEAVGKIVQRQVDPEHLEMLERKLPGIINEEFHRNESPDTITEHVLNEAAKPLMTQLAFETNQHVWKRYPKVREQLQDLGALQQVTKDSATSIMKNHDFFAGEQSEISKHIANVLVAREEEKHHKETMDRARTELDGLQERVKNLNDRKHDLEKELESLGEKWAEANDGRYTKQINTLKDQLRRSEISLERMKQSEKEGMEKLQEATKAHEKATERERRLLEESRKRFEQEHHTRV